MKFLPPAAFNEVDRWGGAYVMIWAAVSFCYKSSLHFCDRSLTGQRYRDEILAPYGSTSLMQQAASLSF
jgi:hypothetical protein